MGSSTQDPDQWRDDEWELWRRAYAID
jgi:hypothetical protein